MKQSPDKIAPRFAIDGEFDDAVPFGNGRIHDTYRVRIRESRRSVRYLLQRINQRVFPDPALLMDNVVRVTESIREVLASRKTDDVDRRVVQYVPTPDGGHLLRDEHSDCWRMCRFIEGTASHETQGSIRQVYEAGRAYGAFHTSLLAFAGPRLIEPIAGFHDIESRYGALVDAVEADACNRAAKAREETAFAHSRRFEAGRLATAARAGDLPERMVHNDAKIDNVLFDIVTNEGICIVDLDTTVPGFVAFDFGDMMRSMIGTAAEDERDLSRVHVDWARFESLARGYCEAAAFLTTDERSHLVDGGKMITLEQGVRFLTDYLQGDCYYKVRRPNHNLDRCRAQFGLLKSITEHEERMRRFIERI